MFTPIFGVAETQFCSALKGLGFFLGTKPVLVHCKGPRGKVQTSQVTPGKFWNTEGNPVIVAECPENGEPSLPETEPRSPILTFYSQPLEYLDMKTQGSFSRLFSKVLTLNALQYTGNVVFKLWGQFAQGYGLWVQNEIGRSTFKLSP